MKLLERLSAAFALVFFTSFSIFAQTQDFTLEAAINYALEHHSSIRNSQLDITDAEALIIENRAIGLPQITGNLNFQRYIDGPNSLVPAAFFDPNAQEGQYGKVQFGTTQNFLASLDLRWLVLDGSYFVGLKAAKSYRELTTKNLAITQQQIRTEVIAAYLPPLIIQVNLETLDKNITNLDALIFGAREEYKEGFIEQLDVDRLELSMANLKVEKENLQRQMETAINYLKFTISYPVDQPLAVTDNLNTLLAGTSEDDLTAPIDFFSRPEYISINTNIYLNELNVKRFRAMYLPSLMFNASYQYGIQGDKLSQTINVPNFWVGGGISIPIFDGLQKKAQIQRANIDLERARIQKKDLERAITLEVTNARTNYLNAQNRVNNQQKTVDLAQKIYNTTLIKYEEGVGSSLELITAEYDLYEAQRNHSQALYDLLLAKTNLNKALGK